MEHEPRRAESSCPSIHGYRLLQLLMFIPSVCASNITIESGCTCQGHNVTFTCTIVGGGSTIWKGSAFDCPSASDSSDNQILLFHSRFGSEQNPTGSCNNAKIQGMGVSNVNGIFTSQLIVTITPSVIGKEVQCVHENTIAEIPIGSGNITATTESDLIAPGNISLIGASCDQLSFSWAPVTQHACSIVNYTLTTSNCGDCPATTDIPAAVCTMEALQPNDVRMCSVSVRGVVCDDIEGVPSETVTFDLKVPDAPQNIQVIPTYAQGNDSLLSVSVEFSELDLVPISERVSGYPDNYTVLYTNPRSSDVCSKSLLTACPDQECTTILHVPSSQCHYLMEVSVMVVASSVFGSGNGSDGIKIDQINSLVDVEHMNNGANTTIFCIFRDLEDDTELFCNVVYAKCDQLSLSETARATDRDGNILLIHLKFDRSVSATYCYTTTASVGNYTLKVEGNFSRSRQINYAGAIAGGVVGSISLILIIVLVVIIVILLFKSISRRRGE